jgi:hypothetical protein
MVDKGPITPKVLNSHSITRRTTSTFRIVFIFPSMGMNLLMSQRTTPIIMRMKRMDIIVTISALPLKMLKYVRLS